MGWGFRRTSEKAVNWYSQAANNGDSMAQRILGDLHAQGAMGTRDDTAAAGWYELAAEAGDADAMRKLGNMYLEGRGVRRDHNLAAKWLQNAAERDDPQAREVLLNTNVDRPTKKNGRDRANGRIETALRAPSRCAGGFRNAPYHVNVEIEFPEPRIDHTHSIAELGRISGLGHNVRALGLMKPELVIETRPRAQGLPSGDKFCFWITGFDVSLRYRSVDVFVAKEYPVGSCPYKAILAHEREHVSVSRKNLEEFAPRVRRTLKSMRIPTGQAPAMVVSAKQARKEVKAISDELLQPIYKDMMKSLVAAQKVVDTPQAYARVQRKCKNW
jgi:TPR repeat protein